MKHSDIDYRRIFKGSPGLLCVVDQTGLVVDISNGWEKHLGLSADEMTATPFIDQMHPDSHEVLQDIMAGLLSNQEVYYPIKCLARHKNGDYLALTGNAFVEQQCIFFALYPANKHGPLALQRYKILADTVPDFIGMACPDRSIAYINPGGMTLVGRSDQDFAQLSIADFVSPSVLPLVENEVIPAMLHRGMWLGELEFVHADGSLIPVSITAVSILDEAGKPDVFSVLARDLRPQKQLEEALKHAIQEMSTPIIEVWNGVLALPVIGLVDTMRASQMMEGFLEAIVEKKCRVAILDLTGVETVDTSTVAHLFKMVRAAALLGSQCVISGISPQVAQTVSHLEVNLESLQTFRTLREALKCALREIGASKQR